MAREFAKSFYNSKAWKDARLLALIRDHFTCQICGGHAEEVHHIVELSPENINDPLVTLQLSNLQCLCHDCHTQITEEAHGKQRAAAVGFYFDSSGMIRKYDGAPLAPSENGTLGQT